MKMALADRNLRSSTNYIWNTSAVLGKGATGSVYQGMSKHTGEVVAVKSFNHLSHMRPYEVQRREYEVLSKVNHENIVKLLAIEEESESQHKVLIMELCTGGSLFNILDDPANSFGLDETEFLLVLKHLAAGMKHLRDMNIIHRDLKPGNIMKFLSEDGHSIYKLTDFGAARELEEDQQFMSLYGTEEYLHPELYARAVLRKQPAAKSFSAKVDLWSIGVTLFHIATGSLPFRPYGGRKNKEMMHRITTEKQQGIISGIQHSDNGDIEWNANLPKTCLLSPSLQDKITPLLAGLLEYNPKNMWTFDQFFQSVTHVLSHKAVHVFCVNNICDYTFYIQPNEKISQLKARLSSKDTAQISATNQLMIWNKRELLDDEPVIFSPQDNPIILLNSKATSIKAENLISSNQFRFPEILNPVTTNTGEQDAQQSKACASIAYCIQRNAVKCLSYCNLINQVPQQVMSLIESNVKLLNEKRESCSHLIESLKDQILYTSGTTSNLSKCVSKMDSNSSMKADAEISDIRTAFEKLDKTWKELLPKMIDISRRVDGLNDRWSSEPGPYDSRISAARARSDYLCARIKDSWLFLHKNKSSRSLGGNESQLHHLEKMRIDNNCKKLLRLLYEDNHQAINELVEKLEDWYNDAHVALVQSGCLFDELSRLMKGRDRVLDQLNEAIESQHQQWQRLVQLVYLTKHTDNASPNQTGSEASTLKGVMDKMNIIDNKLALASACNNVRSNLSQISLDENSDCAHNPEHLAEALQDLQETQRELCASLAENQDLFSELVSIFR